MPELDTRIIISSGVDAIAQAVDKRGKEGEYQIAAGAACGLLAIASAVADLADVLHAKP